MRRTLSRTSPLVRAAFCLAAAAALVAGAHAVWLRPMRASIASQARALTVVLREESNAAAAERSVPVLLRRIDALQARLASLRVAAPGDVDVPGVLRALQARAGDAGLAMTAFKPSPMSVGESLVEWTVAVDFEGTYDGLVRFLESMADHDVLLAVTALRLRAHDRPSDGVTLAGSARITTFAPVPLVEAAPAARSPAAGPTASGDDSQEAHP